jgi:hypothetical protein
MAVTEALLHHCSSCGTERPFEQPPCLDDHGADCPEWACVVCGDALLLGLPPIDAWRYDDLPIDDVADDDLPFEAEPAPPRERRRPSGSPSQAA